jgi:DNA-binding response OmpR family regulator
MVDEKSVQAANGPKILVVEDNGSVRECLETVLGSVGYRVCVAANGKDGLEKALLDRPAVVLLDLHLPDMHGGRILKAIREDARIASTPIIVLTASDKSSDVIQAVSRGANDYMTKPFDSASLITKVSRYARLPTTRGQRSA